MRDEEMVVRLKGISGLMSYMINDECSVIYTPEAIMILRDVIDECISTVEEKLNIEKG